MFIVFEGIDGAGTSTQAIRLAEHIQELSKYNDVLLTHEPWNSDEIKDKLATDKDAYSDAERMTKLYIDDRIEHSNKLISPNLDKDVFVICDRYRMSTEAYQSTQGMNSVDIIDLQDEAGVLIADITFFINTSLNEAMKRMKNRGIKKEKFEDPAFLEELINKYEECYEIGMRDSRLYGRLKLINGNKPIEFVSNEIFGKFDDFYFNKN